MIFGQHYIFDGYGGDFAKLMDKQLIAKLLASIPQEVGMRLLAPPVVLPAEPNGKKDMGGFSGFVILQESHFSIHTFGGTGFVSADLYTCNDSLDGSKIGAILAKAFEIAVYDSTQLSRGNRFSP